MTKEKTAKRMKIIKWMIRTLTLTMLIAAIIFLFITDDPNKQRRLVFSIVQLALMMIVIILPKRLREYLNFKVPLTLETALNIFAFCGFVLGDVFNFYKKIPIWDSLLHAFSGVLLAYAGFVLIDYFVKRESINVHMSRAFICINVVMFSLAVGAIWEIGEYLADDFFGTNNQQYMETTRGTLYGKKDVPLKGHDALKDTMKDLMLDLAGATVIATVEYGIDGYEKKKLENKNK